MIGIKYNDSDIYGNSITIGESGNILLKLKGENRARHIGNIRVMRGDIKYYYKGFNSKKHIFRKNNSIGVNWYILNKMDNKGILVFTDENKKEYKITKEKAKEVGSFLFFKSQGFERQFFIPLNEWEVKNV